MANYIDLNILSQAYLRIEPADLSAPALKAYREHVRAYVTDRSRFFLHPEVEIDIELREGSLVSKITILGSIYLAIGQYGEFRHGIRELRDDVKLIAEAVNLECQFSAHASKGDVIHKEARPGVVGSIARITAELDGLSDANGKSPPDQMAKKIARVREEVEKLLENLHNNEDRGFVCGNLLAIAKGTPKEPTPTDRRRDFADDIAAYRDDRKRIIKSLSQVPPAPTG